MQTSGMDVVWFGLVTVIAIGAGLVTPPPVIAACLIKSTLDDQGITLDDVCAGAQLRGTGRHQFRMCTQSLLLGGNVRAGLEDNLYLEKGVLAKSSAEQVEKIIRIAREFDLEPATPQDAREILGLKGLDGVNF